MGKVFIIGVGPGSFDLLTLRAVNALASCQAAVAGDATLTPSLVDFIEEHFPGLELVVLDKGHRGDGVEEVVKRVRAGANVAHLKNGDPFVFGGLEEETRRLRELGVEYEVVPGVPSTSAACASMGLFPTSKENGFAGFVVLNGHDAPLPLQLEVLKLMGRGFILMPRRDYVDAVCGELECVEVVDAERGGGRRLELVFAARRGVAGDRKGQVSPFRAGRG